MRDEADRKLEAELQPFAPGLLPALREANQARRAEKYDRAAELYEKLRAGAPGFSGATRRLCLVELERGRRDNALELCREAAKHETADNLGALASVLIYTPDSAALAEAEALIERALPMDPEDTWNRMTECRIALGLKQVERAQTCLEAIRDRLPVELSSAADAELVIKLARSDQVGRAEAHLQQALVRSPQDPHLQLARCEVALTRNDLGLLRDCTTDLRRVAPEDPQTHFLSAIHSASVGNVSGAEEHLDAALERGADPTAIARFREQLDDARPWYSRWFRTLAVVFGAWVAGLVLLFSLGVVLSGKALRVARTPPSERSGRASGTSASLRTAYAAVLWLCCGYYYLSIPLVVLLVLAIAALPIVGILALGYIVPKLFLIIGLVVCVTLFALAKSLFIRPPSRDPGVKLALEAYPDLRNVLREVADKVGTRAVDTVFMTPDASIAVFERGGLVSQLSGKSERCLILGVGVLDDMPLDQLRAILAHEYGHFSNRDTAGGGVALAVRRSLVLTAVGLAQGGAATSFNPAWLFVNGYYRLFLRLSQGASRLQEVLADRWAAFTYGTENFVGGLTHAIRRSIAFERHAQATVKELAESKAGLANLYRHVPAPEGEEEPFDVALEKALTSEPTPYDSHPSPKERFELVRSLGDTAPSSVCPDAAVLAWSLFPDREALERMLTVEFCSNVYEATGLEIGRSGNTS